MKFHCCRCQPVQTSRILLSQFVRNHTSEMFGCLPEIYMKFSGDAERTFAAEAEASSSSQKPGMVKDSEQSCSGSEGAGTSGRLAGRTEEGPLTTDWAGSGQT
ncbi:hypothetical protein MUK42_34857 [Musa troglodytarum]|uniref:Uncharacterized protein n=1 Tax=Musa troglodytarum TaxID=320322 RepID=A0A9E7E981_9LILI|nr:hypothetical protein MUK42_34857 [Musa troglodytarum]